MKSLKKSMLALLSAAAVIGFASCSDETQDVNVTDTVSVAPAYTQYYTATGTVKLTQTRTDVGTGTDGGWSRTDTVTVKNSGVSDAAYISWTDNRYTNKTDYTVSFGGNDAYSYGATAAGSTATEGTSSYSSRFTISKVGSKYYVCQLKSFDKDGNDVYTPVEVTVDPTADEVKLSWTEEVSFYTTSSTTPVWRSPVDSSINGTATEPTTGYKWTKKYEYNVTLTKLN